MSFIRAVRLLRDYSKRHTFRTWSFESAQFVDGDFRAAHPLPYDQHFTRENAKYSTLGDLISCIPICLTCHKSNRTVDNIEQRIHQNIYKKILEHVALKGHTLTDNYIKECSELSIIIKTWGYVYEEFFGYNQKLFIQWGDTISPTSDQPQTNLGPASDQPRSNLGPTCKQSRLNCKLDFRIISTEDDSSFDPIAGEAAKTTATTPSKYYNDKLKSVLATKSIISKLQKRKF
ncbi:hypothetical protein INT45_002417 [Circinella minor]|uniref:Uncharacterized protein n=1 Tax=Circinella minor TaxID=1195481 RepID=A0A8H7VL78_9FUNG|nr:hypothetical protein INT45_002417 [Circinella minor]